MLSRLTKVGRWRAGIVLALAYALCALAPTASFAFGDGTRPAHCLTGNDEHGLQPAHSHQPSAGTMHTHADGTSHVHANKVAAQPAHVQGQEADTAKSDQPSKTSEGKCCGLMCVTALPAGLPDGNMPDLPRASAAWVIADAAAGQPPVRLDRPPNSLLPL
jgi:hypothetical protein